MSAGELGESVRFLDCHPVKHSAAMLLPSVDHVCDNPLGDLLAAANRPAALPLCPGFHQPSCLS
jgi:hypothetical protein